MEETTLLQFHVERLGGTLDRSPNATDNLQLFPTKDTFRVLVEESTYPFTVLRIGYIRSSSKKARFYMKRYAVIENISMTEKWQLTTIPSWKRQCICM